MEIICRRPRAGDGSTRPAPPTAAGHQQQPLAAEAAGLRAELERLVAAIVPWLLELPGVGPISAAQVLVSWSYAGRRRSEAAFGALAGANPIPASSGQVTRHRLNRGRDRQLDQALHTIVVASPSSCPSGQRSTVSSQQRPAAPRQRGYWPTTGWRTAPPKAQGMDPAVRPPSPATTSIR